MDAALTLDHFVVAAETLAEGVAMVEERLKVPMAPGGRHDVMGTHNRLLSLGDAYLEVIAVDPAAPAPARARWYGLDRFRGPPRVTNWVARTADLDAALPWAPPGGGAPLEVTRGDLRWRIAVPEDGVLPFGDAFPALIQWRGPDHPARRLPESGCRVARFEIGCADPQALRAALARYSGGLERFVRGRRPETTLALTVETPAGQVRLP